MQWQRKYPTLFYALLVGLAVSGDTITVKEAGLVLVIGVILWIYGIILTKVSNS